MANTSPGGERQAHVPGSRENSTDAVDGETTTCRVGVLSPHNSKETKAILNAVRALGHDPVWLRDENVSSSIDDGRPTLSPSVDVLVNRLLVTKSDQPFEDLQLAGLYADEVPVVNDPAAVQRTLHKYRAGVTLARAGLPVPDAYFARSSGEFEDWTDHISDAATHKRTVGTNGHAMSVVDAGEPVTARIRNQHSFLQEFIDSDEDRPFDVRVYVVGDEVVGAMRRRAPSGEWRTNVALGAEVRDVTNTLGERPKQIARSAVNVLGLDVAGVDLMPADGEWQILEVNATAGFKGLYEATGVSPAPHIAALAVDRTGGQLDHSEVIALETDLDDSVPDCKPSVGAEPESDDVLGYTTRVRVNGGTDIEETVAKADTGASRTSIDTDLAGRIGAGPLVGTTQVRSTTRDGTETRPLVDLELRINGEWRTVTASVTDRSEMNYPVLLGRDVLTDFTLEVSRRVEE